MLARAVVQQLVIDAVALKEDQDQGAIALAEAQEAAAQAYAAKVHHLQPVITSDAFICLQCAVIPNH